MRLKQADFLEKLKFLVTRMHSSRMRTGHSLTICCSLLPGLEGSAWSRGGLPGPQGVCLVQGGSPCKGGAGVSGWSGGVSAWSRGGLPGLGGFSLPGGCLPGLGGFSLLGRGLPRDPPPVNRITDTCKNITLATTSLRPVNIYQN